MRVTLPLWAVITTTPLLLWVSLSGDAMPVVAPAAAAMFLFAYVVGALWGRDGCVPVFDVGAVFSFCLLLYTAVPLIGYQAGGLEFTILSDARLLAYAPTPNDMGAIGWRYVVYFASFAAAYLFVRRSWTIESALRRPGRETVISIGLWTIVTGGFLLAVWVVSGFAIVASYEDLQGRADLYASLPLVIRQLTHNAYGIFQILKLAILVLLYTSWRRYRYLIAIWVLVEIALSLVAFGERTQLLLFLAANTFLYRRFVGRLTATRAILIVAALTVSAVAFGIARDYGNEEIAETPLLSVSNEFQSVFATGYDIAQRINAGLEVPWQIYFADLFRLLPQQLLPFQKIDPGDWYLTLIGVEGTGVGFMFGAIAENVISGDWLGFVIRGFVLGLLFAAAHNFYVKRQHSFYITLFYLWLCLHSYYSIRASMLYIAVWAVYRFTATVLLVFTTKEILVAAVRKPEHQSPLG